MSERNILNRLVNPAALASTSAQQQQSTPQQMQQLLPQGASSLVGAKTGTPAANPNLAGKVLYLLVSQTGITWLRCEIFV